LYETVDPNGNVIKKLATQGLGYRSFNSTLPDGNFVQTFQLFGSIENCTGNITFSVYKNAENISYADMIIPLPEGSWKMSVNFSGCTYDPGVEEDLVILTVYFDSSNNFSTFRDSRGSVYKQTFTMSVPGIERTWDWNWQQVIVSNGIVLPIFLDFVTNETGATYYLLTVPPSASFSYDPDISIVLPATTGADGTGDGNLKIILGVILPTSIVLMLVLVIVVVTISCVVILILKKRRSNKLTRAIVRVHALNTDTK